ncbi:MAG: trypsin-like peptidase domain-containing protein [Planctomycetes bacterium]|nr:trypsin-like peptidase domain-containing protein [Planctomycetota bacterium]
MLKFGLPLTSTVALLAVAALAPSLRAQIAPIPSTTEHPQLDSGPLDGPLVGADEAVVFTQLVASSHASWLRLVFAPETRLDGASRLRLTALRDGGIQFHRSASLEEWSRSSCFFNGGEVVVELLAARGSRANRVALASLEVGAPNYAPESICGPTDDRVRSFLQNQGRLSVGCTGWLIGPANNGLDAALTAGHCVASSTNQILELNVPLSTSGGSLVRSAPNDQYPFNLWNNSSLNGGVGADYAVATVGRNSNTNLLPSQANGNSFYVLGSVPSSGQIRITGYGTSSTGSLNQVQKTHVGPYSNRTATAISYATDTTGGNSGSPIVNEANGQAVGIHTHGGCSSGGGANNGTRIDRSDLATAIRNLTRVPGSTSTFGTGCPATTTLSFSTEPRVGTNLNAIFGGLLANRPATIVIGASRTNWLGLPLPFALDGAGATGCALRVGYDIPVPTTVNVLGSVFFPIVIPNDGALVGARAYLQLLYSHPGLNPASLGTTQGGEIVVGS